MSSNDMYLMIWIILSWKKKLKLREYSILYFTFSVMYCWSPTYSLFHICTFALHCKGRGEKKPPVIWPCNECQHSTPDQSDGGCMCRQALSCRATEDGISTCHINNILSNMSKRKKGKIWGNSDLSWMWVCCWNKNWWHKHLCWYSLDRNPYFLGPQLGQGAALFIGCKTQTYITKIF